MRNKFGFGLIILLVIDIVYVNLLPLQPDKPTSFYPFYVYLTLAYLIIAILTWVELENLENFHLENFTLIIFFLTSVFRTRYRVVGEGYFLAIIAISGFFVILTVILNRSKIPQAKLKWAMVGVCLGCVAGFLFIYIEPYQYQTQIGESLASNGIVVGALRETVNVFSSTAPVEEIIFRGFLWGYLRRIGWGENKVAWVQGILFFLLHIYKITSTPLTFLIIVPILTIISTLLVLRSKQVLPAILSHALINILIPVFVVFLPIVAR